MRIASRPEARLLKGRDCLIFARDAAVFTNSLIRGQDTDRAIF